jgi:hypothetical protein
MGSIHGGDEHFPSEHSHKYKKKINVLLAGKPSTYFEGHGTYVSQCGITRDQKKNK